MPTKKEEYLLNLATKFLSREFLLTLVPVIVGAAAILGKSVDPNSVTGFLTAISTIAAPVIAYTLSRSAEKRGEAENAALYSVN